MHHLNVELSRDILEYLKIVYGTRFGCSYSKIGRLYEGSPYTHYISAVMLGEAYRKLDNLMKTFTYMD